MVSLLLCLLDWCMAVPLSLLLEPITMPLLEGRTSSNAPLLDYIYRVGPVKAVKLQLKHISVLIPTMVTISSVLAFSPQPTKWAFPF